MVFLFESLWIEGDLVDNALLNCLTQNCMLCLLKDFVLHIWAL